MAERPGLIRLAVFGQPVAHSLSPAIHQQFGQQCGLDIDYQAIESTADELAHNLRQLALAGGRGCNITVPLKHKAWQLCQQCSAGVERAQAANTLIFSSPDDWLADNTDGRGLICDLSRFLSAPLSDSRVLIIGAGGATAGILGDLLQQSPAEIVISNRSPERAQALVLRFAALGKLSSSPLDGLAKEEPFDLVINATSLGQTGLFPAIQASWLNSGGLCYDLNYGSAATPLRKHFAGSGIRYQDGLGMLVEQAAVSFTLWTGDQPDSEAVIRRLRQEQKPD